jgi:hypothetical protein
MNRARSPGVELARLRRLCAEPGGQQCPKRANLRKERGGDAARYRDTATGIPCDCKDSRARMQGLCQVIGSAATKTSVHCQHIVSLRNGNC